MCAFCNCGFTKARRQKPVIESNSQQDDEMARTLSFSRGFAVKRYQLMYACLVWSFFMMTASAQTTNQNHDFDSLHQFNNAVRKLISRVTPSVVQVLATGYGPVESNRSNSSV